MELTCVKAFSLFGLLLHKLGVATLAFAAFGTIGRRAVLILVATIRLQQRHQPFTHSL